MKMRVATLLLMLAVCAVAWAQPRAYRGISFGDSPQAVKAAIVDDSAFTISYPPDLNLRSDAGNAMWQKYLNLSAPVVEIGKIPYRVSFFFHNGGLYRMQFDSRPLDANHFDTLVMQAKDNLVRVIQFAHGRPDVHRGLSFADTRSQQVIWSDVWQPNADGVGYSVGIGEADSLFFAALWVQYAPLVEQYKQATQDKQNANQKKSAKDF